MLRASREKGQSKFMTDLNNAVVLITGAAGGFGREMIRQFADAGSQLILHDLRASFLDDACDAVGVDESRILARVASDLSSGEGCDSLFYAVADAGLTPDVVVNNAGIVVGGRIDLVPRDRWEAVVQVNLLSPMRICELFMPAMIDRRSGHFVNVSSVAGWIGAKKMTSYCASKFGLRGFGESLQAELEEFNIRVSTVYPWFSKTPILDSEQFGPDEKMDIPDEIVTDPADIVAAVIAGIRAGKTHIFPDKESRRIQFMKRHVPWLLDKFMRRFDTKLREKSLKAET